MKNKVLVIGLDGATFDLLKPWIEQGKLPNIARIYNDGVHGYLRSTIPPLSPQAWTSFMTGKNPGKHGIFDFIEHRPYSYEIRFANATSRRSKSLWRIVSEAGKKVGVVNMPLTYPAEEVNGFLISGFDAPGVHSDFAYPKTLHDELKKEVGEFDLHGDFWTNKGPDYYLEQLINTIDNQAKAVKYLISRYDCDLFAFVFGGTDRVQHFYWKYIDKSHPLYMQKEAEKFGDAILRVYSRVDEVIGDYINSLPDRTVIIMSDHGAGPYHKIIYLDKWLQEQGLLIYKHETFQVEKIFFSMLKRGYLSCRKFLPRAVKDFLKSWIPNTRQKIESYLTLSKIDWAQTKAFSLGVDASYIFINLSERFPKGTVTAEEYNDICNFIVERLTKLKDPDINESVVDRIYRRDEIYHGESLQRAPDLIVMWKNEKYITRRGYGAETGERDSVIGSQLKVGEVGELMSLEQTGVHRMNGIFIAAGNQIQRNHEVQNAEIIDLAPTILYLLGIPIPKDIDGKVLIDAILQECLEENPIEYTDVDVISHQESTYSNKDAEIIRERLKRLGYLE